MEWLFIYFCSDTWRKTELIKKNEGRIRLGLLLPSLFWFQRPSFGFLIYCVTPQRAQRDPDLIRGKSSNSCRATINCCRRYLIDISSWKIIFLHSQRHWGIKVICEKRRYFRFFLLISIISRKIRSHKINPVQMLEVLHYFICSTVFLLSNINNVGELAVLLWRAERPRSSGGQRSWQLYTRFPLNLPDRSHSDSQ